MTPVEELARSLAVRSSRGAAARDRAAWEDVAFARAARAFATPMPRRRMLGLAAGAAAAAFVGLPTGRARGQGGLKPCPPDRAPAHTEPCGKYDCCRPGGQCCIGEHEFANCCYLEEDNEICGPNDRHGKPTCICRNPLCGYYCCKGHEDCIMGGRGPQSDHCAPRCPPGQVRCSQDPETCCASADACCADGCCSAGEQCCKWGDEQWCCPRSLICGKLANTCSCLTGGRRCGDRCCNELEECCRLSTAVNLLGRRLRSTKYLCCSPTVGKRYFDDLNDMINFHPFGGGGFGGDASARAARRRGRSSAAAGVPDALVALGAVANLGALAADRMRSGRADRRYRRRVRARKPALGRIAAGPGLDAAAARALHKQLSAEARAWSLVNAAAVARGRSLGAIRARDTRAARRQAQALGKFADQAAKALRPVPGLRKATAAALQRGGTPEVTVTLRQVLAYQASVRRGGLPADMRARLTQLGLNRAEQRSVTTLIARKGPEAAAGRVLIEPLTERARLAAASGLAKQLRREAATARRRPFTVSKGSPRTVRGTAPRQPRTQPSRRRRR